MSEVTMTEIGERIADLAHNLDYVLVALEENLIGINENTWRMSKAICLALLHGIQDMPDHLIMAAHPTGNDVDLVRADLTEVQS